MRACEFCLTHLPIMKPWSYVPPASVHLRTALIQACSRLCYPRCETPAVKEESGSGSPPSRAEPSKASVAGESVEGFSGWNRPRHSLEKGDTGALLFRK